MHRRQFLAGTVGVASLTTYSAAQATRQQSAPKPAGDVWLFWDLWHLDRRSQIELVQGQPVWNEQATYTEPHIGNLAAWPTVYQDPEAGCWRMLYSASWKPYRLMVAESDDGLNWRPAPQNDIHSAGDKIAPHHLFTLPDGSGGGVYLDPQAADGFPFKVFVHQQGSSVASRAKADPQHRWHEIAKSEGEKRYLNEEFTLVSANGLRWQARYDLNWSCEDWHPEPPIFGYYNRHLQQHMMTVRPGWGDRRQCLQTTTDFQDWSGPELLFQPDVLDEELIELYGMPVFPYANGYVGLLWVFHCESSEPTRGFNRFVGPLDCQLAFSYDGVRFVRGLRKPFISLNPPGEHGGGAIQPSCIVETESEIRIYSSASKVHHGMSRTARRDGIEDIASITLHTMRKDGFMYLRSRGDWGQFTSKPLVLQRDRLVMNATAPHGEIQYQLTDLESRPIEGYTFDDCQPMKNADPIKFSLQWRDAALSDVVGKIVRLQVRMRHSQLFAFRGRFHFIDAQDRWMIEDGKPIAATMFDY